MKRFVLACLLAVSACDAPPKAEVKDAVVHLPLAAGRPGVAYFTVKGGDKDVQLLGASSPQVIRVELHDNAMENGVMMMTPLSAGVAIPARGTVEFKAGGKHAMLFDINPKLKEGDKLTLSFNYADGTKIETEAEIKPRGEAAGHNH